jgi:hypothetical protein
MANISEDKMKKFEAFLKREAQQKEYRLRRNARIKLLLIKAHQMNIKVSEDEIDKELVKK